MREPSDHIRTLQRRLDFLKAKDHKNSYTAAEIGSLEWALLNLTPTEKRQWVDLRDTDVARFDLLGWHFARLGGVQTRGVDRGERHQFI